MNDLRNEIRDYYGRKVLSEKQIDTMLARSGIARGRFAVWFISGMATAAVLIIGIWSTRFSSPQLLEPVVHPTPDLSPKSAQISPSDTTRNSQKEASLQVAVDPADKPRKTDNAQKSDTLQANTPGENPAKRDESKKKSKKRAPPPEPGSSGFGRPIQSYGITP